MVVTREEFRGLSQAVAQIGRQLDQIIKNNKSDAEQSVLETQASIVEIEYNRLMQEVIGDV